MERRMINRLAAMMVAMVVMMFVAACNMSGGEASASSESARESGPKQNKILAADNKLDELKGDEQAEASRQSEVSDESSDDKRQADKKDEAKPETKKEPEKPKAAEKPRESNEILNVAEVMPQYPGGMGALSSDIASRVTNPDGVQGRVMVKFVVEKNGSVSQASIVRSSGSSALDREVLNGARSLKRFSPAKNGGQPVRVWYTVPVAIR